MPLKFLPARSLISLYANRVVYRHYIVGLDETQARVTYTRYDSTRREDFDLKYRASSDNCPPLSYIYLTQMCGVCVFSFRIDQIHSSRVEL